MTGFPVIRINYFLFMQKNYKISNLLSFCHSTSEVNLAFRNLVQTLNVLSIKHVEYQILYMCTNYIQYVLTALNTISIFRFF